MKTTCKNGPFLAEISEGLLSVYRYNEEEGCTSYSEGDLGCSSLPVFTCSSTDLPWFVMHGDGVYAQNSRDALTPLYRGEDAPQLLICVTDVLREQGRRRRARRIGFTLTAVVIAVSSAVYLSTILLPRLNEHISSPTTYLSSVPSEIASVKAQLPPKPSMSVSQLQSQNIVSAPADKSVIAPADGWDMPVAARKSLPEKLKNAASRELFTVPLSSGHSRTLYVFADPSCPNCHRMERHLETAAGTVNVVIFPVTMTGRKASMQMLTPVMMMPEAERAAAWKRLFAADSGMPVPGQTQAVAPAADETRIELAQGAIGINEVAFRAYRLPGTPWTISDDGRYVSQAVLSSPEALEAFLNEGAADGK